ncbi:MAG: adenosylmethionine--8-amino-7-oxononanoate transaminase [Clostridium sp.]|jgi:adenosylmethionine-8-amino-7-oxononanoate aminotransferase|uniref:adenosylmethionine--8-amino-7-oxononanoate transaminase n=1 Tax=Clostridium sp. TaxID=1506 RepID=UPI0025B9B9CC|nr:adenosylmethionine--8-amino-7-oxononanoate transaminase [Clostridium sp.]MCH3963525.1 adenosylmethionine--8-amino-7-oxononanoate transaminase [Clostridium sp.]MCI1714666.1 adenosylmethionine--8-amino-7-oxononanoate transaminase [Clostridium sp.]MCI1799145.1 adenosylmethionine--8-amino-7-oxononanoate transaminase [Clostridium sp.]MCI1812849.1 adenosylmethionine--8-amino-7-oxononanoate transaminase [Clostridium sp.]MCI1869739.1 adenosylmethionine--8-amino-7-oxononanoate transaminase [Clostrid
MESLEKKDLKYIWHPCTQMKDCEELPPVIIEKGRGCYLQDIHGNSYLDCISSWWTNIFGHSNPRINGAIQKQLNEVEHVIFAHFSNKPAVELAERLINISPKSLEKIFFSDNGSSAVEIALKISFQYYQQIGKTKKTRFAALTDAYHGETIGALSVGALDLYNKIYKPLLIDTLRVQGPDCYRCRYGKERNSCNAECFEYMEKELEIHNEELCAIIVEPMVQGAAGMKIYSHVYLKKLREACNYYDIILIADEIAVGFGRTGKMFACNHAGISPDIMCLSKGISAGYMPMSAVLTTQKIYNAFYDDYVKLKTFIHSHTYAGNAMACAAACESLNIFEDENIIEKNKSKSRLIGELTVEKAKNVPFIGDIRQLGMITAIELVKDKNTKEGFSWKDRVGYEIYKIALNKGLLLRPIGNVLYFMPPYIIQKDDMEYMVNGCFESISEYFN